MMETQQPVVVGDPASMTPPASADGEKTSLHGHGGAPSPRASDADTEMGDDAEEIMPDHYYGGGKIPVFKPTMAQFHDFQSFVHKIDKYGMKSGVVKVIPPKEWRENLPALEEAIKTVRVKNPIMQEFHGSHGIYTQANIEKQRSYNLPQWKSLCAETSHQPPARRGERRRVQEKPARATGKSHPSKSGKSKVSEQEKRASGTPDGYTERSKPEGPPTPVSPESKPIQPKSEELSDGEALPAPKPKGRQPKSVSARRKYNRGDAADYVDEEAFQGFDYHLSNNDEYTPERCEELETAYWKSLMYNNPMYGADMPGSLFDDSVTSWNVAKLPNILDVLGQKVPGVNTAYLYLGMWKATFAWHLEDVDLYSINYIHFGAPKQWYSISQEDLPKFEAAMRSVWPSDAKNCDQFLRHKTYLISPALLKSQYGVTVNKMVHYEGEFVITYPYGYHSGYNLGYNCAESVNFATEKWLDYARVAKKCNCEADSVWVDVSEVERKLRGESTPEYYDEMEDILDGASDLLTPPRSVPEKSVSRKKRKHDNNDSKPKRVKLHLEGPRKIPCVLCPNNLDYEELLPTEDGLSRAHRRCALYIDETSILRDESGKEVVCDVDKIPKARLGLKCLFCREIRGACFQCMYGKCTRAYHPTCALLAGVQVEFGEIAVRADDGCEYSIPAVDLKCKYHRPKRYGSFSSESWDSDPRLKDSARRLRPGNLVQFQADKEINGAVVLENRPTENALLLKVLPRGDVIELPYRWIMVVKKSSFLPLPPGVKPLPAYLARKPEARKDLASTAPSHGTPFGDPRLMYQWAEFACVKPRVTPGIVRVDIFKPNQLWYYLGRTSTECRAQYTDNLAQPIHNPRSNFLESVKMLKAPGAVTSHPRVYTSNHYPYVHSGSGRPGPVVVPHSAGHVMSRVPQPQVAPTPSEKVTHFTMARRLVASITEHANAGAGYTIVHPDFVVQALLGDNSSTLPRNGMEKLRTAMSDSMVQPRTPDGPLPIRPLDMKSDEVDHLLRMLRFAIINLSKKINTVEYKRPEHIEQAAPKEVRTPSANPGIMAYFEIQRRQSATVYRSPYAPEFGFSDYAIMEYGLTDAERPARKEPLAADFFGKLSPEDKEKVIKACGNVTTSSRKNVSLDMSIDQEIGMERGPNLEHPPTTTSMDALTVDNHLSVFEMTLHADSPASNFERSAVQYHPTDLSQADHEPSLFPPRHLHDHHDLFGDQQGIQRFWQRSIPWTDGDTQSHDEGHRPFFGPHERPAGFNYAASDMDLERGPGSLHSMDMASFNFDGADEFYPDPSP